MWSNTMDTPALRHFAHEEHPLTDATLYVRYPYQNRTVEFYVGKDGERMTAKFAHNEEDIDGLVATLATRNDHNLDFEALSAKWKTFLTVVHNGVVTEFQEVKDETLDAKCGLCDSYHFGGLEIAYVPAFPEIGLNEASLRLEWEHGCGEVRVVAGELNEVRDEALALIDEVLQVATGEANEEIDYMRTVVVEA